MSIMLRKLLEKWKISGYNPCVPLKEVKFESKTISKGIVNNIDAVVPGNVYRDLWNAGIIPDPYYGMNSLLCEWVPARWWVYNTEFCIEEEVTGRLFLRLESICYKATIYFNDIKIGCHENMFTPFEVEITQQYKLGKNDVKVVLEHQPDEYSQVGFTSKTITQKSRYDYKWDFSTRMINVGLLKPVTVFETPSARIKSYYFCTDNLQEPTLEMEIDSSQDVEVNIIASLSQEATICAGAELHCNIKKGISSYELKLPLQEIKRWYPNGYGDQELYQLDIRLYCDGLTDCAQHRVGLKELKLLANEGAPTDALRYLFCINGERVYLKGINIVPLDLMLGTETKARYRTFLKQLKEMNINFIRVWGGGVIEDNIFYDLCSEYGIMVWQDLIQSSSGIDNYPSQIPEFMEKLNETTEYAALRLQNYVSLCAFCGGNELMDSSWRPVDFTCPNIGSVKKILNRLCPSVPFFPSTPSGPRFAVDFSDPAGNHDIHGEWRYLGPQKHYEHYNQVQSLLHSEFGVDGLICRKSAEKFMPVDSIRFVDMDQNELWRHRGECWDCYYREYGIFGDHIQSYDDFADCSQFIQYEGLRYILECDRFRAWKNSGSFIWQANEPWPNISCTNLIDYYGCEKAACIGVRRIYDDVAVAAKYNSLIYGCEQEASFSICMINERGLNKVKYTYCVNADECEILRGEGISRNSCNEIVEEVSFKIPKCKAVRIHLEAHIGIKIYPNDILWLVKDEEGLCSVEVVRQFLNDLQTTKY